MNTTTSTTRLGDPRLRIWELTDESSRYDQMRAAPSDTTLHGMWIGWSTVFFVFATYTVVVFLSILLKHETRQYSFNKYLLALMGPDVVYTSFCAFQCAVLAAHGGFTASWQCHFQAIYAVWGIAGNSWLNGAISLEIHHLLRLSNRRQRYYPPTTQRVVLVTAGAYVWSLFVACWGVFGLDWLPHEIDNAHGIACTPLDFDLASSLFFWLVFFPLLNGIPVAICFYVTYDIVRHGLLPPEGKSRDIAIFFFRILVVFLVMWLPCIIVFYMFGNSSIWAVYFAGMWAHAQGSVSATVCLLKPDIWQALKDFATCRTWGENQRFRQQEREAMSDENYLRGSGSGRSIRRILGSTNTGATAAALSGGAPAAQNMGSQSTMIL